jgi:PhnB protein
VTDRKEGVIPHLVVNDATAALQFYEKALGASVAMRVPAEDKKRIMHAEILVNGATLYVRDHFPEHCTEAGKHLAPPSVLNGTTVTLHLAVEDCDAAVQRAAAAGATVTMPPMDAFWGERFAQIEDPFGHGWSFAHPLRRTG